MQIINTIISISGILALGGVIYLRYKGQIRLGFSFDKWALSEFMFGIGIGFISVAIAFFTIKGMGYVEITGVSLQVNEFFEGLGFYALGAAIEEVFFRVGLLLILIYFLKNVWIAILIQIILFGFVHINNPDATYLTAFSNAIGGLMYSLALIYTGRIWMPFSLHVFWNFAQSFWGFNVSGISEYSNIFMTINPQGSDLLSGGAYGLEGSVIGIGARFLVLGLIIYSCKWMQNYNPELKENQISILPQSLRPTVTVSSTGE
jgi:membrane protease YdiL (CAAX protease family)